MNTATALPQTLTHNTSDNAIEDESGNAAFVTAIAPPGFSRERETALAAELVRRWNCHEELVAALAGMREWARRVKGPNPGPEVVNAINALAHATP